MANVFDEAEAQIKARSVFDVASEELSREEKAKERRAEGEQLLKRTEPVTTAFDDPIASLGTSAGHQLTRAALLSGGKKTDVALGVLGPLAATAASAFVPVPGSTVAAGAASSGAADALVQAREYFRGERDDLSKGRLLASTALGAIVPPSVKAAATPLGTAVKTVATRGAQGAGLGAAHEAISEAVDEGKLSAKGIITAGVLGTLFGAGFGTLEGAAPHILKLLRGKTVEEAKKVIAEELPKLDTDAAMDAATKAEVRGLLEGAQKRIDDALGIKPETATPTAGDTAIGRQTAAEKAFGGEAPLTRIEKADERAAALTAARAEDVRQTLLSRQAGAPETTVLTGDEAQNQLTKLETRPGNAQRERARLLARQEAQPEVGGVVPANVETSPQAERVLAREGFEGAPLAPQVARPTPIADLQKRVDAVRLRFEQEEPRLPSSGQAEFTQRRADIQRRLADVESAFNEADQLNKSPRALEELNARLAALEKESAELHEAAIKSIAKGTPAGDALGLPGQPIEDAFDDGLPEVVRQITEPPPASPPGAPSPLGLPGQPVEEAGLSNFPKRPELPDKARPGSDIFRDFYDASKAWEKQVGEWLANVPEKKPIIWQEQDRKYGQGSIRALTRNIDPDKPWRVTTFVPNRQGDAFMPWGHQEYKTRTEALIEDGKHIDRFHDRMPVRVMTEPEILGYTHLSEVDPKSLKWYAAKDPEVVEKLRQSRRTQGLVIDSFSDGKIAFTEPVDTTIQKAFGLSASDAPSKLPVVPKAKRIGLPADGEMDILNHVQELGGIRHPDNVQEGSRKGGEYDGFPGLWEGGGLPRALVRRDGGGSTPDQLVGELRANGVPVRDPDHLFELIEKARKERPKKRADVATQNYVSRFETAFLGDAEKIAQMQREGKGITVDDLRVGDTFTVNKEKFRVTGIDENGFVTVKDGITRTVEPGTPIFPDKDKINRAGKKVPDFITPADEAAASTATEPKVTRAENFATDGNYNVEFPDGKKGQVYRDPENGWWYETGDSGKGGTPPLPVGFNKAEAIEGLRARIDKRAEKPFSLASATNEQQAAEAAANRERLLAQERTQKIQTLAEKPLTGDSSDVGQGTLLAGDEDLFSGPSAETLAKRDPKQAGFIDRRLLFSTPLQSALGGIAGGVYGSKQGDTPEERAQNMLLYGAAGAGVGAASRIVGRAALNRMGAKATYEIDKHLTPPPGKSIADKLSEAPTSVKAATLSVYAPLDKLEDDVRKAASWLYVLPKRELPLSREFEQVAGATGKGGQDVRDYARNVLDAVGEKDRQNFDRLVALKRIEQRLAWNDANASDRKVVGDWTHAKVAGDLAKLESDIGAKRVGELDAIASGIMQREADDALRLQVESGRLSQEAYDRIKADNDFYAPFKVLDHLEGYDTGGGRAVDTRDQLAKVIEGIHSTDFHIENPSVALAQHIFKGRVLAEKNLKMQELAKLADNDVSGSLIRKLGPDDEVRRGYEAVNYFDNGKPMRLEVRPEVAEAVKGLNVTESGLLANFARQAGGLFRFGATTGNLAFQPVNFALADQPNLWLVSRYGLRGAEDIARAPVDFAHGLYASIFSNLLGGEGGKFARGVEMADRLSQGLTGPQISTTSFSAPIRFLKRANAAAAQLAREFHESGATGSNWQELVDTMGGTVDEKKFAQSLKLGEHSLLDSIGSINKAIEESTKMMGFKRGVRIEGLDKMKPADAAEALKKVVTEVRNFAGSPDFMRSGYATRDLNNLVQMFLNARVQGITNLTGRLAGADGIEAARNAWLRIAGTIGVGAAYVWYQNHRPENEADYRSRSETERKNYFLFPRYDDKGAPLYSTNEFGQNVREYWRLPKREVLQYMGNTVESALDFAHEKDPEAVSKYVTQMAENLSPVNISGKTGRERMESVVGGANPLVKVPYEQLSGRDTFRHRDILPTDDLKRASPGNQFVETTPKLLVNAAHAMPDFAPDNLRSPMLLQNLVEGTTGRALTQFLPRNQPEGRDPAAASVASNPLTSRFAGSLYVDRSAEQAELDKVKQGEADIRVEQRRTARQTINELKKLTPEEVSARLTDIAENRPKLFEAIMSEAKKNDRDVIDRQLLGLGVKNGARAQFIVGQLRKMDPEKAADYLSRLSEGDGAPLTPEVFEQVALLLQVQPEASPAAAALTPEANKPVSDGIPTMTVQEAFKAPPGKFRGTNGKTYIKQANGQIIESK